MRNNEGFTLLEILIAMFIFTIVSIMMVETLHTAINSQTVTAKNAEKIEKLQLALLLMSRDFGQAIDRPVTNAKNMSDYALIGTPRTVTFTHSGRTNPKGIELRSTLQRTQYSIENHRLIRSIWPVLDQTAKTEAIPRVLYDNIENLRFEYLDDKGKFQNNWPKENSTMPIPVAIRVTLFITNWGKITQTYLLKGQNVPKST